MGTAISSDGLSRLVERAAEGTTFDAIRVEVVERQAGRQAPGVAPTSPFVTESTYAQGPRGARYFDSIVRHDAESGPAERQVRRTTYYSDGRRSAEVSYGPGQLEQQAQVYVGRDFGREARVGFAQAPPPLRYYYVGLTPLPEALPDAVPLGTGTVLGRPCTTVRFDGVGRSSRPQALVYHVDTEAGIPLKVTAYENPEFLARDLPNWRWEATRVASIQGRLFPMASTYTSYVVLDRDQPGRESAHRDVEVQIDVARATFDRAVPRQAFWPAYQPGVFVLDTVAKRSYRVPGGAAPETRSGTGEPIRVNPPAGGWLVGTGIGLSLGVLLLAAWLRGRSR